MFSLLNMGFMKLIKRLSVAFLIVLIVVFCTYAFTRLGKDDASADDHDLHVAPYHIPKNTNAFEYLKLAIESLRGGKDEFERVRHLNIKQADWDDVFVSKMIAQNEEALGYFQKAVSCQHMLIPDPHRELLYHLQVAWLCCSRVPARPVD